MKATDLIADLPIDYEPDEPPQGPRSKPALPWRPFPKVFPDRLWRYTVAKAAELEVDPAAVAIHILPAMSGAIGIGREIRLGTLDSGVGHWEPPIIWALLLGRTGRTKSPAQDAAVWPLWAINRDLKDAYTDEKEEYENDLEDYNSRKKKTKPDPGEPLDDKPKPTEPKRKYLVIGDMTKEKIVAAAEHSPRGFIQVSDEAGTFLSPRGGSDKKGEERAFACCCFGARPYLQGRVTRDGSDLERLGVSLSGCVPPATLKSYIDLSDWRSGFVARFVMVNPPKVEKRGEKKHTHPLLLQEYENLIRGLYATPVEYDERGRIIPHRHFLSPEAAGRWRDFEIEQDGRVMDAEAADREELEGVLSKLTGYAARFALVLHLARAQCGERVDPDTVDLESLNRGIRLAEFFAYESERLLPELRGGTPGADTTVIDWIGARGGECTANELAHGVRRFRNDPDGAEEFLMGLVREGMGTWVNIPPGPSGGTGKRLFRLNSASVVTATSEMLGKKWGSSDSDTQGDERKSPGASDPDSWEVF